MSKQRQYSGDETIDALSKWKKDQKAAERLAGSILHIDNFVDIDPSHPLGGRDGKKDILCKKGDKRYVVAVYFPRTQQEFSLILKKIKIDYEGVSANNADGLIVFTNRYLTLGQRNKLKKQFNEINVEIFHLERVASILNSPIGYGVRLEFLDIELSKTEQLSYFAHKDKEIQLIQNNLSDLLIFLNEKGSVSNISTEKLKDFKETLETIVGDKNSLFAYGNSMIDRLQVPLTELKEFQDLLSDLTGSDGGWLFSSPILSPIQRLGVPLKELEEFKDLLYEIIGDDQSFALSNSPIDRLSVPIRQLDEYNDKLDEVIEKLKEIEDIQNKIKH